MLEIFDDLTVPLHNLFKLCNPGGLVLIFAAINDYPVDLITRYRHSGTAGAWERGWNYFSKRTYEELIRNESVRYRFNALDVTFPFDLPRGSDPMRTWTVNVDGRRTITCGAGLLLLRKTPRDPHIKTHFFAKHSGNGNILEKQKPSKFFG